MDRGFALVTQDDHVITSVRDVNVNDDINLRFKDGYVDAVIKGKKEN
jgi:exonuclease VII large subunit